MTLLPLMLTDADRFGLTPSQARHLPGAPLPALTSQSRGMKGSWKQNLKQRLVVAPSAPLALAARLPRCVHP